MDFGFLGPESGRLEQRSHGHFDRDFFLLELIGTAVERVMVIIYSAPSCIYCKMLKDYLRSHNVSFTEKDVVGDLEAREEMIHKSHQMGVPVADIDGEIFVGFNRAEIAKKLGIK